MPKILIADDEPGILMFAHLTLSRAGYTVGGARDGAEALEKFKAERYDLVLTDMSMPCLDGLELIAAIKEISPTTPAILFTADAHDLRGYDLSRVVKVLPKPATRQEILEAVQEVLNATPAE